MLTKEQILKKIQKLAREKGKTPSEKEFYNNTDVIGYDRMRYWPNYGELVREAGLMPNKFDKTKYNHQQLCEMFIGVIREKQKWPTRGDLDVKHHADSNFPDSGTFYSKLGLTQELAKTILEFIAEKEQYDDINKVCEKVLLNFADEGKTNKDSNTSVGFVYLQKMGRVYKIGKTFDPISRAGEITIQLPEKSEPVHYIKTDDPSGVEAYWHNRFKSKRKNGEWFNLNSSDIKTFKRWRRIF